LQSRGFARWHRCTYQDVLSQLRGFARWYRFIAKAAPTRRIGDGSQEISFRPRRNIFWTQISNQGLHNWVRACCASDRLDTGSSLVSRITGIPDHQHERHTGHAPTWSAPSTHRHCRRNKTEWQWTRRTRRARRHMSSSNEKNLRRRSVKNGHIGVCCLSDNCGAR
jgi:hypothetical protein